MKTVEELIGELKLKYEEIISLLPNDAISSPYFDNGQLSEFIALVENSIAPLGDQTEYLVSLVQASLSGKTRLIIEASIHHPLILISFKKGNTAYKSLVASIREQQKECKTFNEREELNYLILLKIRVFLLSFMDFAKLFKIHITQNKSWKDVDKATKVAFSALLLNGGGEMVNLLFKRRLKDLNENLLKKSLRECKDDVECELKVMLNILESPWIAFDECHVPRIDCGGVLFHSDYTNRIKSGAKVIPTFFDIINNI